MNVKKPYNELSMRGLMAYEILYNTPTYILDKKNYHAVAIQWLYRCFYFPKPINQLIVSISNSQFYSLHSYFSYAKMVRDPCWGNSVKVGPNARGLIPMAVSRLFPWLSQYVYSVRFEPRSRLPYYLATLEMSYSSISTIDLHLHKSKRPIC